MITICHCVLIVIVGVLLAIALHILLTKPKSQKEISLDSRLIQIQPPTTTSKLRVPTVSHIVVCDDEQYSSNSSIERIQQLWAEANAIWAQAGIEFYPVSAPRNTPISSDLLHQAIDQHHPQALTQMSGYNSDARTIHVLFVNTIATHTHGRSYPHQRIALVADSVVTVPEGRTLAHEMAHMLGLHDVYQQPTRLLSSGSTGHLLTEQEIATARQNAIALSSSTT